jgi:hypothetical protein
LCEEVVTASLPNIAVVIKLKEAKWDVHNVLLEVVERRDLSKVTSGLKCGGVLNII